VWQVLLLLLLLLLLLRWLMTMTIPVQLLAESVLLMLQPLLTTMSNETKKRMQILARSQWTLLPQ
jgi:hypothetical protein